MRISDLKYFIATAFRSVFKNGLMSMVSIFTVVCCLLILGLFLAVGINVNYISDQVRADAEIKVIVSDQVKDTDLHYVTKQIKAIDNVREATLVTKADALNYMKTAFAEDASALDGLQNDNPFRTSYKVKLRDITHAAETSKLLGKIHGVAEVSNKQELLDKIIHITNAIKNGSGWIMVLLSIISIFIIANTIKLAVYARRREINIMKFVGATDWFIRWPFIIEGILIGIIGSIVAFIIISIGYIACLNAVSSFKLDLFAFKSYQSVFGMFITTFIVLGTLIGALGSGFSMRKYLEV
jgi:Cell division protein